jgi:subtilisin family serine protease
LFTNSNNYQAYLEQVKAPEAWDIPIGSVSPVIIGIVDSGSQLNHSDLAANITHDYADPINGVDDDHDGYIDNLNGWDFVGAHLNNPQADNDPNVVNASNAHGVHVSGLAAAETNNGVGIASIANNYAQILIIKAGADDDSRAILAGYEGIKYAVDHGAKVISCSWGGGAGSSFGQDIINYAINSDCLVVAAAGNENIGQPDYPSAYPGVFSVASVSLIMVRRCPLLLRVKIYSVLIMITPMLSCRGRLWLRPWCLVQQLWLEPNFLCLQ